ncbi:MAG: hypothetical protein OEQ81_09330 [Flavobacteriaceae bacterium]|nr:hypothetical protein [Flavobacteriaceae bacterium]
MAQDLRKLFEEKRGKLSGEPMKEGHEERFLDKLEDAYPTKTRSLWPVLRIAASVAVLILAGIWIWNGSSTGEITNTQVVDSQSNTDQQQITIGDLSPDLKKVEDYYMANISLELAQLDLTGEKRSVAEGFITQLGELDSEYSKLNAELNEVGPNDQTISALIRNLQLRLQLLHKLKETLDQFKSSENEQDQSISI